MANDVRETERRDVSTAKKRVYKPTESLLTRCRQEENPYAEGLFNLTTVHIMLLPVALILRDFYDPGSLQRHLTGLRIAIGGPKDLLMTAFIFLLEFLIAFAVYFIFLCWSWTYRRVGKPANAVFLPLLILSIITYRYLLVSYLLAINFPPAARFACCLQQLLFFFKWISFIYENAYKVVYPWKKDDATGPAVWYEGQMKPQVASFSSYVFFLFCPVLLYRDMYPRKQHNYKKALSYFAQFVAMVWVLYVVMFEFALPKSMHRDDIRRVAVQNLFLGFVCLSSSHTFLLHGWSNCWAELLGFADRSFYDDWWNTRTLPDYLRKWNPIIYDWLKAYIHPPVKKVLPASSAKLAVLLISAFEHDFILSTGLGYFMPVYLVEYGILGMLLLMKPKCSRWTDQMIMAFCLSVGFGLQITLYSTEVAAQIHCPGESEAGWLYGLRMVSCYGRFNN